MGAIRLAGVIEESYTDGVGIRCTLFTQGCNHKCHNCHNPETWDFKGGKLYDIDKLIEVIKENPMLDGITVSGGDPMYRTAEVLELITKIRERTTLNIWLYTGFTYEECLADTAKLKILQNIDILVDGAFDEKLKSLCLRFRGSSNQRIIDVKKSLETGEVHKYIVD